MDDILVVISCITFNHEPYIRDCLDGFVMQKTNFKFVAIVHDDASTDKTADIIREYEAKYPDIIKPIYETENQWHKTDGSLGKIMDAAIDATGAKYIAMCEGDDYWTDPLKLQKQVDFLEAHEDVGLCYTDCDIFFEKENRFKRHILANEEGSYLTENPLKDQSHDYTANMTWVYRRSVFQQIKPNPGYLDGAVYILLSICSISKIGFVPGVTGVYRRHEGSASCFSKTDIEKQYRFDKSMLMLLNDLQPQLENGEEALLNINSAALFDLYRRARKRNDNEVIDLLKNYFEGRINMDSVDEFLDEYEKISKVYASKAYKLGKAILKPLDTCKVLFSNKKNDRNK